MNIMPVIEIRTKWTLVIRSWEFFYFLFFLYDKTQYFILSIEKFFI